MNTITGQVVGTFGNSVGGPDYRAILEFCFKDGTVEADNQPVYSHRRDGILVDFFLVYEPLNFPHVRVRIVHKEKGIVGSSPIVRDPMVEERVDIVIQDRELSNVR